jgi:hypothetical protein
MAGKTSMKSVKVARRARAKTAFKELILAAVAFNVAKRKK